MQGINKDINLADKDGTPEAEMGVVGYAEANSETVWLPSCSKFYKRTNWRHEQEDYKDLT